MSQVTLSSIKTQYPELPITNHRRFLPSPKSVAVPQPTIYEKLVRIFCCCCYKPKDKPDPETPPRTVRNSDGLGFRYTGGQDEYRHQVWSPSRRSSTTRNSYDPHALYTRLNAMDYTEAGEVISDTEVLAPEKKKTILQALNFMQEEGSFLDPELLAKRIEDIPETFLEEIRTRACLAAVLQRGENLPALANGLHHTTYKKIIYTLDVCYCASSTEKFIHHTSRTFENINEQVECIRWGVFHDYKFFFIPASMGWNIIKDEKEEHINSYSDPVSPKSQTFISQLPSDTSLEQLSTGADKEPDPYSPKSQTILGQLPKDVSLEQVSQSGGNELDEYFVV